MKLDAYHWFTTSAPDDVRWEKVEDIKRILTGGTYAVPAIQVAAKLFKHMMELDRANPCWEHSRSSSKTKSGGTNRA